MTILKKTWLYQQLAAVFGNDLVITQKEEPDEDLPYQFFPIKEGMDTVGWVGLPRDMLTMDTSKLIQVLSEHQHQIIFQEEDSEESLWQQIVNEERDRWEKKWRDASYSEEALFKHVYLYIDDPINELETDIHHTLKETIEGVIEEKSFFLPLYGKRCVWVIPEYEQMKFDLLDLLRGLVDTIATECMIDIIFYVGESYFMPTDVRRLVKEELKYLDLAVQHGWEGQVVQYTDLVFFMLLSQCHPEYAQGMVDKLIGPVKKDKELLYTVETFLQENLNVSETAKKLYIHRNSMQYRLEKFIDRTGVDIRQFEEGVKVYLAIQALGMFNKDD